MRPSSYPLKKIFLTMVFGLFSIPMLGYAGYLFVCWARIHFSDVYYADYGYMTAALIWISIGLLSFRVTWYGAWRRSFHGLLFVVPVFLGLASMVTIPDAPPHVTTLSADYGFIKRVTDSLRDWYEKRHRFPADESEFWEAMARGTPPLQYRTAPANYSKYKQRGSTLAYAVVVIANADSPRVTDVSPRPGVTYYCVSSDLQEFWVTMTGLESDLATSASLRELTWWEQKPWVHRAGTDYAVKKQ